MCLEKKILKTNTKILVKEKHDWNKSQRRGREVINGEGWACCSDAINFKAKDLMNWGITIYVMKPAVMK